MLRGGTAVATLTMIRLSISCCSRHCTAHGVLMYGFTCLYYAPSMSMSSISPPCGNTGVAMAAGGGMLLEALAAGAAGPELLSLSLFISVLGFGHMHDQHVCQKCFASFFVSLDWSVVASVVRSRAGAGTGMEDPLTCSARLGSLESRTASEIITPGIAACLSIACTPSFNSFVLADTS